MLEKQLRAQIGQAADSRFWALVIRWASELVMLAEAQRAAMIQGEPVDLSNLLRLEGVAPRALAASQLPAARHESETIRGVLGRPAIAIRSPLSSVSRTQAGVQTSPGKGLRASDRSTRGGRSKCIRRPSSARDKSARRPLTRTPSKRRPRRHDPEEHVKKFIIRITAEIRIRPSPPLIGAPHVFGRRVKAASQHYLERSIFRKALRYASVPLRPRQWISCRLSEIDRKSLTCGWNDANDRLRALRSRHLDKFRSRELARPHNQADAGAPGQSSVPASPLLSPPHVHDGHTLRFRCCGCPA